MRPVTQVRALDAAGRLRAGRRWGRLQEAPRGASEGCFGFTGTCRSSLLVCDRDSTCVCVVPGSDVNGPGREVGAPHPFAPPVLACWAEGPPAPRASYHHTEAGTQGSLTVENRGLRFTRSIKAKELPFFPEIFRMWCPFCFTCTI